METLLLRRFDDLLRLENEWNSLLTKSETNTIFLTYEWMMHDTLGKLQRLDENRRLGLEGTRKLLELRYPPRLSADWSGTQRGLFHRALKLRELGRGELVPRF